MPSGITLYRAPNLPSLNLGGVTGAQSVLDSRGNLLALPFPTNGVLDSVWFTVRISGHASNLATTRGVTVVLYIGSNPASASSNNLVATTLAHNMIGNEWNVLVAVDLLVNGTAKILHGVISGILGSSQIAAATTTPVLGIDPNQDNNTQGSAPLFFSLTWNATSNGPGEFMFIDGFELRV